MIDVTIRDSLTAWARDCDRMCREEHWLRRSDGLPGYRLLYSSIESFESGNGYLFLGMNPGGTPDDIRPEYHTRPFTEPGYSAYLDEQWTQVDYGRSPAPGQHGLQRALQEIAMLIAGADLRTVLDARGDWSSRPENRIGHAATALLRGAPSANILPFSHRDINQLPPRLRDDEALNIGWQLCTAARPEPRTIISLTNNLRALPLSELRKRSGGSITVYEETVHQGLRRTYREVRLQSGPLRGTTVVGLPALVRDHGRSDIMVPLLQVIAHRVSAIASPGSSD